MADAFGKSGWIRYFQSPILRQGPRETRQFYVWRMTLLAYAYPEALYPLYAPMWALQSHNPQKPREPIALSLLDALTVDRIVRHGGDNAVAQRGAHFLAGGAPSPDTDHGYAALALASQYVGARYAEFDISLAAAKAAVPDPAALLHARIVAGVGALAAIERHIPQTRAAAYLLHRVLEHCVTKNKLTGTAAMMAKDADVREHVLRECAAPLDAIVRVCVDAQFASHGALIGATIAAYEAVMGRAARQLSFDQIDALRTELHVSVYTFINPADGITYLFDDPIMFPESAIPAPTVDSTFRLLGWWATRGVFAANRGGYTAKAVLKVLSEFPAGDDVVLPLPKAVRAKALRPDQAARNAAEKRREWRRAIEELEPLERANTLTPEQRARLATVRTNLVIYNVPAALAPPPSASSSSSAARTSPAAAAAPPSSSSSSSSSTGAPAKKGKKRPAEDQRRQSQAPPARVADLAPVSDNMIVRGARTYFAVDRATLQPVYENGFLVVYENPNPRDVVPTDAALIVAWGKWETDDVVGDPVLWKSVPQDAGQVNFLVENGGGEGGSDQRGSLQAEALNVMDFEDIISDAEEFSSSQIKGARIGSSIDSLTAALRQCRLCA